MNFSSWNKLQVKYKVCLFALLIFVVTDLFYIFLLVPKWTLIDELKNQSTIEEQQVNMIESFVKIHPNPEEYLVEMDSKILDANKMLPDTPDLSSFLLQIEQLSTECGLKLAYLKPGKVENKQGYREIAIEFSVKGNFAGIMKFLYKTESLPRFISITAINMQLGTTGLENKMVAKIYSYGNTTPLPTTTSTETKK